MTLQDIRENTKLLKGLSGAYRITCTVNGKSYVGNSKNFRKRFQDHLNGIVNENNTEYNKELYQEVRKYGLNSFTFHHESECLKPETERDLIEKYYGVLFGYNNKKNYGCFNKEEYRKNYRKANKESIKVKSKAYREANKETIRAKDRARYWSNKLAKELQKDWRY